MKRAHAVLLRHAPDRQQNPAQLLNFSHTLAPRTEDHAAAPDAHGAHCTDRAPRHGDRVKRRVAVRRAHVIIRLEEREPGGLRALAAAEREHAGDDPACAAMIILSAVTAAMNAKNLPSSVGYHTHPNRYVC